MTREVGIGQLARYYRRLVLYRALQALLALGSNQPPPGAASPADDGGGGAS